VVSKLTQSELNDVFGGGFWKCFKEGFNEMWSDIKDFVSDLAKTISGK
jgi:hypothetical protein